MLLLCLTPPKKCSSTEEKKRMREIVKKKMVAKKQLMYNWATKEKDKTVRLYWYLKSKKLSEGKKET